MKSPANSLQLTQHRLRWKESLIKELVVEEVVKIDKGEASFFYLLLIKFSQTDQPDSLGIYSHLSRRYKLLEECFERRDSYIDINTNSWILGQSNDLWHFILLFWRSDTICCARLLILTFVLAINCQLIVTLSNSYCDAWVKELDWLPKGCRFETHKVMNHHCSVTPGCSKGIVPVISVR